MTEGFPSIRQPIRTGETGVNAVSSTVNNKFEWIFRRNHNEHDFGIDGYIDIVTDSRAVTGQCLAVQIKTGKSFLRDGGAAGFTFYGELKHLNYYLNLPMPVLIVIHDDTSGKTYWQHFSQSRIEGTPTGWKMLIPRENIFERDKKRLLEIVGPPTDHLDRLKSHWVFNDTLSRFDFIHYAVDRKDIEDGNVRPVISFFRRIEASDALCRKFQGRVELSISGYDADRRELWEIRKVCKWFKKVDPNINWFYFCNLISPAYGFKAYMACLSNTQRVPDQSGAHARSMMVSMDNGKRMEILESNWPKLNAMTDRLGMSIEENKRISFEVLDVMEIPH
ncbi:DUF4365 domain-containing protein [Achromobacter sp. UMC71]|jgi:hypothetical protein|uniref:DUF4365 domain-containing protein n=1 Tax=Achromobacter sp. UMC71 TaxID=1862320 RepID=UPI0015FF8EB4|nr:DUF4365 and DUF1817 domain-containing protein [Achromobacter sp. UMC71]